MDLDHVVEQLDRIAELLSEAVVPKPPSLDRVVLYRDTWDKPQPIGTWASLASDDDRKERDVVMVLSEVPLDKVVDTQSRVHKAGLVKYRKAHKAGKHVDPPSATLKGDRYYINDGHHRVTVARERGVTTLPMWVSFPSPKSSIRDAHYVELAG